MSDLEAALRDYLKDAPPVLSPDGQYMRTMDGRPVVLDVVAAHIALAALRAEPASRDFFTREAVTGGMPTEPSPVPRDEARESAIDVLRWFAKRQWHFLLAPEQNDQTFCARSVQALGAAEWLAAAPRADPDETTDAEDETIFDLLVRGDLVVALTDDMAVGVWPRGKSGIDDEPLAVAKTVRLSLLAAARAPGRET